jgi:transposase
MQKIRKTYTQEFKREAVRLAQTSGKSIAQIARELGISDSSIHQWRKELAEQGPDAFPACRSAGAGDYELPLAGGASDARAGTVRSPSASSDDHDEE